MKNADPVCHPIGLAVVRAVSYCSPQLLREIGIGRSGQSVCQTTDPVRTQWELKRRRLDRKARIWMKHASVLPYHYRERLHYQKFSQWFCGKGRDAGLSDLTF